MKILFVAAEVAPFSSIGGLSQVMYFLPRALMKLGHDVRIFTPKYASIDGSSGLLPANPKLLKSLKSLKIETEGLSVPAGNNTFLVCNVKSIRLTPKDPLVYFLENREYYELRANVYQYADDHVRFALLSKGCLEWLLLQKVSKVPEVPKVSKAVVTATSDQAFDTSDTFGTFGTSSGNHWFPDLIHCNDWHTGYLLDMARWDKRYQSVFAKTSLVYTVHNFRHQGNGEFRYLPPEKRDIGREPLPDLLSPKLIESNALVRGIINADMVNTVSKSHAEEVLTREYGEGIDDILREQRKKLTGILNGLDTKELNPAEDPKIKFHYSWQTLSRRTENKLVLQREFSLPKNPTMPVFALSGRMDAQKGIDLVMEALPRLLANYQFQLVVLGGGAENYRQFFQNLAVSHPDRIGVHLLPNFSLPRKIFAGADVMLMPSKFEPGGIVAMEAMRYGAVPLVRRTGGLGDIITDFDPGTGIGNGLSFREFDPWALYGAMVEALTIYKDWDCWKRLVVNCMRSDYSWDYVAREYDELYRSLLSK